MREFKDYPLWECDATLAEMQRAGRVFKFHQKFSCDFCGSRQTCSEPNQLFTSAKCELCGTTTDLTIKGCNYVLLLQG